MGMGWKRGLVCGKFRAGLKAAAYNDAGNDINFPTQAGTGVVALCATPLGLMIIWLVETG
jgi:hypothetical protein